jgi:hypothetical protein
MFYLVQYKRNALYDVLESNEENSFTQNEDWAYTPTEAILSYSVENGLNELSEPFIDFLNNRFEVLLAQEEPFNLNEIQEQNPEILI